MTIALIQKKGGVGKTTLAVLLHQALQEASVDSAVQDYDPQGSASKALNTFGGVIAQQGKQYSILIVDSPPNLDSPATRTAAISADVILIPTGPSPLDLWEANESAIFARTHNPHAEIRIVFNRLRAGTLLSAEAANFEFSEPSLKASLSDWQTYQHAVFGGWSAMESKAKEELHCLALAITSISKQ